MHARVVKWENGDPEAIRRTAQDISSRAAGGPPEGLPAVGFTLLVDPDNGQAIAITLFETEEKLRQGHELLMTMDPPGDGMGTRVSVDFYAVATDLRT
jgi:hypothetical protein